MHGLSKRRKTTVFHKEMGINKYRCGERKEIKDDKRKETKDDDRTSKRICRGIVAWWKADGPTKQDL